MVEPERRSLQSGGIPGVLACAVMADRDDTEAFARAMRKVDRLDEGTARVASRRRRRNVDLPRIDFVLTTWGDHQQGVRAGVDSVELRRLELGDYPPEATLDLHHLGVEEARDEVRSGLRRALRSRLRSVRIVHGQGRRSAAGPVLKEALPKWLAEPPHGRSVLAFTTTGAFGAGGGATLVLLSKKP